MPQTTRKRPNGKPVKPHPDFPLFPHATGRWAKKVRGKLHYFGPWADANAALTKWLNQKDELLAGRVPRPPRDDATLRLLANRFLTAKEKLRDGGEITPRTFQDYHDTCARIIRALGADRFIDDLDAQDFESLRSELAKSRGPVALGNEIQRVRIVFRFAYDATLIPQPVRYGPHFKRPSRKVLRHARAARGLRMFEASQIRAMIKNAGMQLRAMIYLGVNAGLGNSDIGNLPKCAVDLKTGWMSYPRPKTGVARRCHLWPETVAAIKAAVAKRPSPKDPADDGLLFITKRGYRWSKDTPDSPVSKETAKILGELKIVRRGLGFYALRHTFETIAGETLDQPTVDYIMGHARDDMATTYRERIGDDRIKRVSNHVREWLFPKPKKTSRKR